MEKTQPPLVVAFGTDSKRQCIRIKARIKIRGEQESLEPAIEVKRPYQAYCETVISSRSQSPDVFTTPPTHSQPFQPVQISHAPTYTARITTRKVAASSVLPSLPGVAHPQQIAVPISSSISNETSSKQDASTCRIPSHGDTVLTGRYNTVTQSTTPRGSHLGKTGDRMSRNHTPSLSQGQEANLHLEPPAQIITTKTPLWQKRLGRMEYRPLPPLPPSPPDTPISATIDKPELGKTIVNFSRGEMRRKPSQPQEQAKVPHLTCVDDYVPLPVLSPSVHRVTSLTSATTEHERPQSKASRRTVTFADDTTLSSRSSSPDHHIRVHDRTLRQSKSFSPEAQIPSSLRLHRSHDSLLVTKNVTKNNIRIHTFRRTTAKDFKHKYTFGQRPASRMTASTGLGRTTKPNYNPRLSTSKAQYRGLATLSRPLPSSLRIGEPQQGPRQPPWGTLEDLEEQRGKRMDTRERDQAKQFRYATLSQATTVGSIDSFGREEMKREVEEYKEQVMSVYPDMAFDGSAGKGGRSCCCAVM